MKKQFIAVSAVLGILEDSGQKEFQNSIAADDSFVLIGP
jgi:hypothetical protein